RMLFGLGRAREAPAALQKVHARAGTPWVAALAVLAGALALLPLGSTAVLGGMSSLAALGAFAIVNAAVVALRLRAPRQERAFRVPLSVGGVPVLPVLGGLGAIACATQLPPEALAIGLPTFAALILLLAAARHARRRRGAGAKGSR
ncbi:MAG TPA: hypothetical protein VHI93_07300, partial [Candidatus Thermoplasmatota archaeon]|nr:hypothetical protein [Candidatus Thermoplasmatota archaeon]